MADILQLVNDPRFKALSSEDQQDLVMRFHSKYSGPSLPPELAQAPPPPPTPSNRLKGTPEPANWGNRLAGGALGLATGGPGLGAFNMMFPPQTAGDYASNILPGPLGKAGGKILSKMGPGILKTLMSGGLGAANTALTHVGSEAINRGANKLGLQNAEQDDMTPGALQMAIGTLAPAIGTHMLDNKVRNNPTVRSNEFMNQQTGQNLPVSQIGQRGTAPIDPSMAGVMKAAENPQLTQAQTSLKGEQTKLQALALAQRQKDEAIALQQNVIKGRQRQQREIVAQGIRDKTGLKISADDISDSDKLRVDDLTKLETDLLDKRSAYRAAGRMERTENTPSIKQELDDEIVAAQKLILAKKAEIIQEKAIETMAKAPDPTKLPIANTATEISRARKQIGTLNYEKKKMATAQDVLRQSITDLKETSGTMQDAMNPLLRKIAWDSPDPAKLIQNFMDDGTPDAIKAFKAQLAASPNGARQVEALQKSMLTEFFKRAYDPNTKSLSNAQKMFAADGQFSAQKIEALYGPDKVNTFRQAIDDIQKLEKDTASSGPGFAKHAVNHFLGWSLPMGLLHAKGANMLAAGTAAAGASFGIIMWPKLIDSTLKNPKFADMFHRWATSDRAERSLRSWPTIARFFDENSESVSSAVAPPEPNE